MFCYNLLKKLQITAQSYNFRLHLDSTLLLFMIHFFFFFLEYKLLFFFEKYI